MTSVGWKRFKFFEDVRLQSQLPDNVSCACCGPDGIVWIGSTDGYVAGLDNELNLQTSFAAHQGRVVLLSVQQGKLISIGYDDGGQGIKTLTLKAWQPSTSASAPSAICSAKLFPSGKPPEGDLDTIALSARQWPALTIAIGLSTSTINILKTTDITGSRTKLTRAFPPLTIPSLSSTGVGITGIYFSGQQHQHIFATTTTHVVGLSAVTGQQLMIDESGAAPGCSALSADTKELLLAGPEAICFYSIEEGRKASFAVKGDKQAVATHRRFFICTTTSNSTATGIEEENNATLTVYDLSNKVIAASIPVQAPVRWVVSTSSGIIVADAQGTRAVRLTERSLAEKLDILYRSRAFHLALSVAQAEKADARTLADVRRRFGDFLHGKRDYDGATEQYAATVGVLEPSYVIQRFLDAQRIHNLTTYLEALHTSPIGRATADHTSLLLRCYTKLKDVAKLDAFVSNTTLRQKFDAETAITVLRGAGYSTHALTLAETAGRKEQYLDILIEDCKQYAQALAYIRGLEDREAAAVAMKKYGNDLLTALPVETTALLMELCLVVVGGNSSNNYVANFADFTHLYAKKPEDLQYACITILEMNPNSPSRQVLYHTLLDLYLSNGAGGDTNNNNHQTLSPSKVHAASSLVGGRRDALELLKRGWIPGQEPAYDVDRALVACRMHNFSQGLVFLYQGRRMFREALTVLADVGDWEEVLIQVERHGDAATGGDAQLWHYALERLSAPSAGFNSEKYLQKLLDRIEENDALPPLSVLQVLATNPKLKLEMVKGYVTRQLQAINKALRGHQEENDRLKGEIEKTQEAVRKLKTEPVVFQSNRDSQTNAPLEPPSVHFLCGHSFNTRTLGDLGEQQQECPLCAPEHQRTRELQKSHKASALDKDAFFRQLRTSPDGFDKIAEYFGKGLLNNTTVSQNSNS